jgi:hypothetical protein
MNYPIAGRPRIARLAVIAGVDPASILFGEQMDARVKPAHDESAKCDAARWNEYAGAPFSVAPSDNRPQQGAMDTVILPVSCCDTNASVRVDI